MALVRCFEANSSSPKQITLNWLQALGQNNTNDEVIITRTKSHYPMELFNEVFPDRATDSRPVEIFRGKVIVGTDPGTISVSGDTLTDTGASFPTVTSLAGRLLRDSASKVHRIISNTATSITLESAPANGKYVVLADFPLEARAQENYEIDTRTTTGPGFIQNLVVVESGTTFIKLFEEDELSNLLFQDGNGDLFVIKSNTETTVTFFETTDTPVIGNGMAVLNSFVDSLPVPYVDNFRTGSEAANRLGSELEPNQFYYYTAFTKDVDANVAQAEFATVDSGTSTQKFAISTDDKQFGNILYNFWSSLDRELDSTGDLEDLMQVFGFQFNEIHSLIQTYNLQDPYDSVVTVALPLSEQTGLPAVGFSIGADTLRRIAKDMIACWKLKGTKEGLYVFIKKITTWDITGGSGNISGSITDFLPNIEALRFFDPNLGSTNTRITQTDPFTPGGRFARSLPGIVIPGFFTFREFVISIPNVALFVGNSETFSVSGSTTTMIDSNATFGATNQLVGNFLIPNTEEINDIFEIVANDNTSITVQGTINNRLPGGNYAILSPLNTNRFIILNQLLPVYIPFGTKAGFQFTVSP